MFNLLFIKENTLICCKHEPSLWKLDQNNGPKNIYLGRKICWKGTSKVMTHDPHLTWAHGMETREFCPFPNLVIYLKESDGVFFFFLNKCGWSDGIGYDLLLLPCLFFYFFLLSLLFFSVVLSSLFVVFYSWFLMDMVNIFFLKK